MVLNNVTGEVTPRSPQALHDWSLFKVELMCISLHIQYAATNGHCSNLQCACPFMPNLLYRPASCHKG